jgi:hypothetical protein
MSSDMKNCRQDAWGTATLLAAILDFNLLETCRLMLSLHRLFVGLKVNTVLDVMGQAWLLISRRCQVQAKQYMMGQLSGHNINI